MLSIGVAGFISPLAVLGIVRTLRGFARRVFKAPGLLAGRSLTASLARTSIVVGALATAIAMMISVAIMVGSFRETVILWLDTQLRADLYVAPAGPSGAGVIPPLPPDVPRIAAHVPGVADTDVLYAIEFHYGPDRATLGGVDTDVLRRYGHLRFLSGEGNRDAVLASLPHRDRVIISEPFANKHHLRTGDTLSLNLGPNRTTLHIAGIYFDYSSDRGFVMLDRSTLLKYLPAQPPTNLAIYVNCGALWGSQSWLQPPLRRPSLAGCAAETTQVQQRLRAALAGYAVNIAPNEALRRGAMIVFDRTFAITWALEGVAIIVAMLGAANSLLALVLDRRRDLGLLQYLGAAGGQIRRMILVEAGFLGLMAATLGLALGSALSLLLIYVINKQSFGWTIQFHPPLTLVGGALLLVWSFTVLAGLYPAHVASRLNPIEVVHEE
jgi:putative ABC transport system permease protein